MSNASYWSQTYHTRLQDVASLLLTIDATPPRDMPEAISNLHEKMTLVENARKSFQLDLRALPRQQQAAFMTKFKEYEKEFRSHRAAVQAAEERAERAQLTGDGRGAGAGRPDDAHMDNDAYIGAAKEVQSKTDDSLERTANKVQDTHDVADSTAAELQRQREQLEEITATLLTMQGTIARAGHLVQDFKKRIMTDRLIRVFFICNLFMLCGVIVFWIVSKNTTLEQDDDDTAAAPNTDDITSGERRLAFSLRGSRID